MKPHLYFFLIFVLALDLCLDGETIQGNGSPLLMLDTSCAEGMALANISVMQLGRSGFLMQNPALVSTLKGLSLDFTYLPWLYDTVYMAGDLGLRLSSVSVGFSVAAFDSQDFDLFLRSGDLSPEKLNMNELLFGVSAGLDLIKSPLFSLSAGAGMKFISSSLSQFQSHGMAFDLGTAGFFFIKKLNSQLVFGLSLLDLGKGLKFIAESTPLPLKARAGAGLSFLILSPDHRLCPMVEYIREEGNRMNLGLEYSFKQTFFLRAGYILLSPQTVFSGLTAGTGLSYKSLRINYGLKLLREGPQAMVHTFSLGLDLE